MRSTGRCGVEQFKDASCGYSGPLGWCDRTRGRCEELGNLERFDGVLPPLREPWMVPWWDVVGGGGMLLVMLSAPPWWLAAPLYVIFCSILLPPVREELYFFYLHRSSAEQDNNDS